MPTEHWMEDSIICPYCDHEFSDSWEYAHYEGTSYDLVDCDSCSRTFRLTVQTDVSYTTKPLEEEGE